jgi:hypothetical protein
MRWFAYDEFDGTIVEADSKEDAIAIGQDGKQIAIDHLGVLATLAGLEIGSDWDAIEMPEGVYSVETKHGWKSADETLPPLTREMVDSGNILGD